MIDIVDFKKISGEKIPDIVGYVKDYVKTHSNIDVMVERFKNCFFNCYCSV